MGVESNGVMHKKWIRNEGRTEGRVGGRDGREQKEPRRRGNEKNGFDAAKHFCYS